MPSSIPRTPARCPCGSGEPFAACCGALHAGRATAAPTAPTAERLMRSRYSAFAVGDSAYLLATWHPSTRPPAVDLDDDVLWQGLEIVDTAGGGEEDDTGIVEFVASYRILATGQFGQQRERSTFRRLRGQWYYVDAAQ